LRIQAGEKEGKKETRLIGEGKETELIVRVGGSLQKGGKKRDINRHNTTSFRKKKEENTLSAGKRCWLAQKKKKKADVLTTKGGTSGAREHGGKWKRNSPTGRKKRKSTHEKPPYLRNGKGKPPVPNWIRKRKGRAHSTKEGKKESATEKRLRDQKFNCGTGGKPKRNEGKKGLPRHIG